MTLKLYEIEYVERLDEGNQCLRFDVSNLQAKVEQLEGELKRWLDNDPTRTYGDLEAALGGDDNGI